MMIIWILLKMYKGKYLGITKIVNQISNQMNKAPANLWGSRHFRKWKMTNLKVRNLWRPNHRWLRPRKWTDKTQTTQANQWTSIIQWLSIIMPLLTEQMAKLVPVDPELYSSKICLDSKIQEVFNHKNPSNPNRREATWNQEAVAPKEGLLHKT